MRTHLVVLGGFLGAGKTTTLLRLAQNWIRSGRRIAIITNDQAENLVDTEVFRGAGLTAGEVAGGCFCCRLDDFVARAEALTEHGRTDIILAEPVGSCTDIVATVVEPLRRSFADRFTIAPYTVAVDPMRALRVLGGAGAVTLSERVTYIYRLQQVEASVIAINKIDAVDVEEHQQVERLLRERFPNRQLLTYSARTGQGLDSLQHLLEQTSERAEPLEDIDYDAYAAGEAQLAWLNASIHVRADETLAIDEALLGLGHELNARFRTHRLEVAHCKLLLEADGRRAVVSIVDSVRPPALSVSTGARSASLRLTLNMRVQAEPASLDEATQAALASWASRERLHLDFQGGQSFKPPRPVPTVRVDAGGHAKGGVFE